MKKSKQFVRVFLYLFVFILLSNALIWNIYTKNIFPNHKTHTHSGDLARIGYTIDTILPRKSEFNLNKKHIDYKDYKKEKIDVLTIGDSFSQGGGTGLNSYYQDYIASNNNFNVLNIQPYKEKNYIETISIMINNGFLDRIKPKYIVIESVERLAVVRFANPINFKEQVPTSDLISFYNKKEYSDKVPTPNFLNNANYKFMLYKLLYKFSDNAFFSETHLVKLNKSLFSIKNNNKLLFIKDDVASIPLSTTENIDQLNSNLNILSDELAKKGIKLYFMPAVDKYDAYSNYIVNNKYQKSTFFEKLRAKNKRYSLIDTKEILSKELAKGEKDVFYPDDTHWSCKASNAIFSQIKF